MTRARSKPRVTSTCRTLRGDRHVLRGVCGGVPMNVRLCGGSKLLVSLGGGRLRVFRVTDGRSILKIGLFRGPLLPRRVGRGLEGGRSTSFAFYCRFSGVGKCCRSRDSKNDVSLAAGMAALCSRGRRPVGCLIVGMSGARGAVTCGGVRRFGGFFSLMNSCTGINCTRFSTLDQSNCTLDD